MSNFSISSRLREAMEARNMIPAELSRQTGLSNALISQILNQPDRKVTFDTVSKLSKALGVTPTYFTDFDAEELLGPSEVLNYMTEEQRAFVLSKDNLPFVVLGLHAKKSGLSPDKLKTMIQFLVDLVEQEKNGNR